MTPDIRHVQRLAVGTGEVVIPGPADYDAVSDGWRESEHRAHLDTAHAVVGAWEGDPGWVRIDEWPYTEVCVIRSGTVEIIDREGSSLRFGAGEAFVIPQGFSGSWRTLEPCEKVFVGIGTTA